MYSNVRHIQPDWQSAQCRYRLFGSTVLQRPQAADLAAANDHCRSHRCRRSSRPYWGNAESESPFRSDWGTQLILIGRRA
jgi:hypothetical protein